MFCIRILSLIYYSKCTFLYTVISLCVKAAFLNKVVTLVLYYKFNISFIGGYPVKQTQSLF